MHLMQYSGTNVPVILSASKNLESFGERRLFADAQSDSGGGLRVTVKVVTVHTCIYLYFLL